MIDKLCRIWFQTPYMDVIKQGQVMAIMYHPEGDEVLASYEPILRETNDLHQSPVSLLTLRASDTGREYLPISGGPAKTNGQS